MTSAALADRLLDIRRIYHEPGIERFARAREVLHRFFDAERIEVLTPPLDSTLAKGAGCHCKPRCNTRSESRLFAMLFASAAGAP